MSRRGNYQNFGEADIIRAARERLLAEIAGKSHRQTQAQRVINNIYGGGGVSDGMAHAAMGGGSNGAGGEDPFDYFVNITRKDLPDINPATGKPAGWEKQVHRYRSERDGDEHKKKAR